MAELSAFHDTYTLRITGGEVGLVTDLSRFIDWLNCEPSVLYARIYTNGMLLDRLGLDLKKKCRVYEHYVHQIIGERLVRYSRRTEDVTRQALGARIVTGAERCLSHRLIIVDTGQIEASLRSSLTRMGIKFVCLTGPDAAIAGKPERDNLFCFNSRYLYIYDVANHCFQSCCEVKYSDLGTHKESIVDFLTGAPGAPYALCSNCQTCGDIKNHRNAPAIEALRTRKGRH